MPLAWRDTMSMDESDLDHEHKLIILSVNALEKAHDAGDVAAIQRLFSWVLPHLKRHFEEEEAHFERIRYLRRFQHKQLHAELIGRAEEIHRRFSQAADDDERLETAAALHTFFEDYVFGHVMEEDVKVKHGAKQAEQSSKSSEVSMIVLDQQSELAREQRRHKRSSDLEYHLPPQLEHLLKRIEFTIPELPPVEGEFSSFPALCESAIFRHLDRVLLFFHRSNPELRRELPPLFLSSAKFREKFHAALRELVLPLLWDSRQVRLASSSLDLAQIDTENFWTSIEPTLRAEIMHWWRLAWTNMRPVAGQPTKDGRSVMKVKDDLKRLRVMLQPDDPADYDLPKIGPLELDIFSSLLDVETDWWAKLTVAWTIFVDLYEQEKDPRVFQQKAREGALRDFMLESFSKFPTEWLDFLLLCCHATFPRVTTMFLENFTRNYDKRDKVLPYTMRYLELILQRKDIRHREAEAEALYIKQREELRDYLTKAER